jgi:hypothetical protein
MNESDIEAKVADLEEQRCSRGTRLPVASSFTLPVEHESVANNTNVGSVKPTTMNTNLVIFGVIAAGATVPFVWWLLY